MRKKTSHYRGKDELEKQKGGKKSALLSPSQTKAGDKKYKGGGGTKIPAIFSQGKGEEKKTCFGQKKDSKKNNN